MLNLNLRRLSLLLSLSCLVISNPTIALSENEIQHVVDIHLIGMRLVAIRSEAPNVDIELRLNERDLWIKTFGQLGAVVTTERFLVISHLSESWFEMDLRLEERKPKNGHISTDLIFYDTGERVLGFDRLTHSFIEWDYAIAEEVVKIVVDGSIAGVILNNRVIGYTAGSGVFVVHSLGLSEKPLSVNIKTDIISLVTSRHLLTYHHEATRWTEEQIRK